MAIIDVPGFITEIKDHAVDHGFHVHDERQFIETYSMRQAFEVDLHPEAACGGPLDLHLGMEVDPRIVLSFEDVMLELPEGNEPPRDLTFALQFTWSLPPLPAPPDLLLLATELAGLGGPDLPLEVAAVDSIAAVTEAPERSLAITARVPIALADIFMQRDDLCDTLDRCNAISHYLLDRAPIWLNDSLA